MWASYYASNPEKGSLEGAAGGEAKGDVNQSTAGLDPVIVNLCSKEDKTDDVLSK